MHPLSKITARTLILLSGALRRFALRPRAKIAIAVLIAIVLLCPVPLSKALAAEELGDLNADGRVDAADAAVLLRALEAPEADGMAMMDISANGLVDEVDARILLHFACGGIPTLADFGKGLQSGLCDEKYFDRFCYTGVLASSGAYYRDDSVSVEIRCMSFEKTVGSRQRKVTCYIAEIFLKDISYFKTALSSDAFHGKYESVLDMAARHNAIVAISGDFYNSSLHKGPINRNGTWYRDDVGGPLDVCALLYDGTLITIPAGAYSSDMLQELAPYQLWCFGPSLITADGAVPTSYNSGVTEEHPRAAIGSDGPGHYFFILVDGRRPQYSSGLNMTGLSELFIELGCTVAYNLDGGQTAVMASKDALISIPISNEGRSVSDILYIAMP